ncbi:hypothetical protein GCM10009872_53910 [Actinopolymorpha rutila]
MLLVGWVAWCVLVHNWAAAHGYRGLLKGIRPGYPLLAAVFYFPATILLWHLLYPADTRALPWERADEDAED